MTLPFILLAKAKKKVWCQNYCPRASLIQLTGKMNRKQKPVPRQFTNGSLRKALLWYFGLNLLFITGSTLRIARGFMEPMAFVRLFIAIPLFPLPQLIDFTAPPFLLHLSYRLYSMMLSSTILGIAFSLIWRKRLWCAVCPVGSLSNTFLGIKS
jgi:polyferredoxin